MNKVLMSAAVGCVSAAVILAPAAAADTGSFLDELSINGALPPGLTNAEVIAAGNQTCSELRAGTSVLDEMSAVEQRYNFSQGTLFVSASTTNLCPDFAG